MTAIWVFMSLAFLVHSTEANPCAPGGVTLNGSSSGVVSSPGFPGNFPSSSTCIWKINVPSGRIKLTFHNFTLNPNENTDCSGGAQGVRVTILNVASNDDKSPFKLCGQTIPAPVYSVSTSMEIQLTSLNLVYSGFNASYETITDEMLCPSASSLTDQSGDITSPYFPRKYPNNQDCNWEIIASKGNQVKLEIKDMQIEDCGAEGLCTCDYLEILDGFNGGDGAASGKLCVDGEFTPMTYYSVNERLRVRFFSNLPVAKQYKGFKATYTLLNYTPPECPNFPTPLSGNGTFGSPNYPKSNYPSGRNCYWLITAAVGKQVKVTIKDFAMGATCDNCNAEFCSRVEFYDGPSNASSYLGRFCSGSQLTAKVSSGSQMFVKFYSSFNPDRGFQAEYSETTEDPSPTEVTPTVPSTTGAAALSMTLLLVILPSFAATLLWH